MNRYDNNTNNNKNDKQPSPGFLGYLIVGLAVFGAIMMIKDFDDIFNRKEKCVICDNEAEDGEIYCSYHMRRHSKPSYYNSGRYSSTTQSPKTSSGNPSSGSSSYSGKKSSSTSSSKRKYSYPEREVDPLDHDIDVYYEDYKDEFEDEDDAWDDFEDNEEYWDDY